MRRIGAGARGALALACAGALGAARVVSAQALTAAARERLQARVQAEAAAPAALLFYERRDYRPAWSGDGEPLRAADELLAAVSAAAREGLRAEDYAPARIRALLDEVRAHPDPDRLAELDLSLTAAFLTYGSHLAAGRIDPPAVDTQWSAARHGLDLARLLQTALDSNRLARVLMNDLPPPQPGYARLRTALARYREIAAQGGRNVGIRDRIRQIELNLERWRWLPRRQGARYIMLNTPAFALEVVQRDTPVMTMRAIVGTTDWPTPIVSGTINALILNPAWEVPKTIAARELLPLIRSDSGYLAREQIRVFQPPESGGGEIEPAAVDWSALTDSTFPYRLRQEPGPTNPLGRVKFVFPNRFNVCLHDTPARKLFAAAVRTFSHGCIRASQAVTLAVYLLQLGGDSTWRRDAILAAIAAGTTETLPLPEAVPVHFVYWTAWARPDGTVEFRPDIYGWDARLSEALSGASTKPQ